MGAGSDKGGGNAAAMEAAPPWCREAARALHDEYEEYLLGDSPVRSDEETNGIGASLIWQHYQGRERQSRKEER